MEKFKILSVTGGVPRYLEEVDSKLEAENNIKNFCFKKGALLQIDYMIQTRFGSLYICEIKFSKNTISSSKIIEETQQKISKLKRPKGLSCDADMITGYK